MNDQKLPEQMINSVNFTCFDFALNELKHVHKHGCPWDEQTCIQAAAYGHLDCLKYAHENECPWTEETCLYASTNGHLECLKYAHENGCPWNEETCLYAAQNRNIDCFVYAYTHGAIWKITKGVIEDIIVDEPILHSGR